MTTVQLIPGILPPGAAELAQDMLDLDALKSDPRVLADLWHVLADKWQAIGYSLHEMKCRKREMKYLQRAATERENSALASNRNERSL